MRRHGHPFGSPFGAAWRRGLVAGTVAAVGLAVVFGVGYLERDRTPPPSPAPPPVPGPSPTTGSSAMEVAVARLVEVPGGTIPVSVTSGPRRVVDGRASGFSHDAPGAALAAATLAVQASAAAGSAVYEPTISEQCWGDTDTQRLRARLGAPPLTSAERDTRRVRALYYRVVAGDPLGDRVTVAVLADSEFWAGRGGFGRSTLTLRWFGGDWQLLVPVPEPTPQANTIGYRLLARS
jgi:hypothetical protein